MPFCENVTGSDRWASYIYHGFVSGLLRGAGLNVKSNREHGLARSDIVIEDGRNKRAIIIELKTAAEDADPDDRAEEGLRQIEERRYEADLGPHIRRAVKYGIAFQCHKVRRIFS